ncbi:restriction endonuclease subunit S [Rathayibacter soli]|uniref:restriction endonuclease subunit S n=1 Tax=Rathayibacter soli TaxID=3144168 RepID=UPI0027E48592|nr:restriction endonuclease subunit S [Glaciibacter superstes]
MSELPFGDLLAEPLRNGVSYPSRTRGSGFRMINMREIFAYDRLTPEVECELVPLTSGEQLTARLERSDLLFARQSLTYEGAGKVSLVLDDTGPTWDSHLIRARLDLTKAAPPFYYYFFKSPEGRRRVETIIQQVAAAGVRGSDLARLSVPVPPRRAQQAIAEVLSALDDKIAANTALAATADELMRAEYASFNGRAVHIGDVAGSPRSGVDPLTVDPQELYVGLEHLGRRNMWLSDGGEARDVTSAKSKFEPDDVLFGKLRPYFHKVVVTPTAGICSTDILVVRARDSRESSLLIAALSSDAVVEAVVAASEGTRMPRTSWKDLAAVEIRWPDPADLNLVASRLDAIREATLSHLAENRTLAATRDALLPRLMSGKLRVHDAEVAASEAGA